MFIFFTSKCTKHIKKKCENPNQPKYQKYCIQGMHRKKKLILVLVVILAVLKHF